MNIGYGCVNWTIRDKNTEKDQSSYLRQEVVRQLSKFGKVTIVSSVIKSSRQGMIRDWNVSLDMDSEPEFDILLINASSDVYLNFNKNFERLLRIIAKAKSYYLYMDDTEQTIPEKQANKLGYTFYTENLKGIFSTATKIEEFRKVKKIPSNVNIRFVPHFRPNIYEDIRGDQKSVFFGFLGSRWAERAQILDELLLGLPEKFKPSIGFVKGWDDHKSRTDLNLLGWVDQSWYGKCIATITVHRGKSIQFGWTPSKLPGETFHRNVIVIFEKETFDSFSEVFKFLPEYGIKPFVVANRAELEDSLEQISNMTESERIEYCRKWVVFMDDKINPDTLYKEIAATL